MEEASSSLVAGAIDVMMDSLVPVLGSAGLLFLPDGVDRVLDNLGIGGQNGQALDLALGYQHAVKGIAMMAGQSVYVQSMTQLNRQGCDGI